MPEEKGTDTLAAFAHMGAAFARTPFPYLLGCALMLTGTRWDGHLHDSRGCVQLQEMHGKAYKVDTCSGKVDPLEEPAPPTVVAPKPSPAPPVVAAPKPAESK
jgi:hypothetical protein